MKRRTSSRSSAIFPNSTLGIIALLIIVMLIVYYATCNEKGTVPTSTPETNIQKPKNDSLSHLEIPAIKPKEQIVHHAGYTLSYNEEHEQANWVAYELKEREGTNKPHYIRTDRFLTDPKVKTGSADGADYEGSGYDRGHLAPAEDMSWSETLMEESFYYSNMSPQAPAFNRGVWRRLESLIRYWSDEYDSIYVVTGPVLKKGLPVIGHDKVSVPEQFYKVVLEYNSKGVRCIGFVLPAKASSATLKSFAVSVDSVETLTGIDFFPKLPDDIENKIESKAVISDWKWTRKKSN